MAKEKSLHELSDRRMTLLRRLSVPKDALPGSLSMTNLKCGKQHCHCMTEQGKRHPAWSLTYMSDSKKIVRHIPAELVDYVQEKVAEGKDFRETLNQVLIANADLLLLRRKIEKK